MKNKCFTLQLLELKRKNPKKYYEFIEKIEKCTKEEIEDETEN